MPSRIIKFGNLLHLVLWRFIKSTLKTISLIYLRNVSVEWKRSITLLTYCSEKLNCKTHQDYQLSWCSLIFFFSFMHVMNSYFPTNYPFLVSFKGSNVSLVYCVLLQNPKLSTTPYWFIQSYLCLYFDTDDIIRCVHTVLSQQIKGLHPVPGSIMMILCWSYILLYIYIYYVILLRNTAAE